MADHYNILGIPRNATKQDIEAAWRNAVKEWHPDRNRSNEAKIRLQQINTARDVLMNDRARREYDRKTGYIKPEPVTKKMERPVRPRPAEEAPTAARERSYRQPGFATRQGGSRKQNDTGTKENQHNEWWARFAAAAKRNAEAVKNEALRAAAEEDRKNVASIAERRPRLTRYVLMPLGIAAILIAAVITVVLV